MLYRKNFKCKVFNLENNRSIPLKKIISLIEKNLNKKAIINFEPIQDGDVIETDADIDFSKTKLGYNPKLSIEEGYIIS